MKLLDWLYFKLWIENHWMIEKRGRNIVKRTHEEVINIFTTKFFWPRNFILSNYTRHEVVVITTARFHSTKPEAPACFVSEICGGEDLWQWSQLKLRLDVFHWSTTPQKKFYLSVFSDQCYHSIPPENTNLICYLLFIDDSRMVPA